MKMNLRIVGILAAGIALLTLVTPAMATPVYTIIDLGDLPGGYVVSVGTRINDSGQVVGVIASSTINHAFLWQPGVGFTDLGDLPGGLDVSAAFGINGSGQVAGVGYGATGGRAVLWQNGDMTDLGDLPVPGGSLFNAAIGINDLGQVVGVVSSATSSHAFLWQSGVGMTDLGGLAGGDSAQARGINNNGQVVGNSDAQLSSGAIVSRAVLWDSVNGMTDLGSLIGGSNSSSAYDINNDGQVVGDAVFTNGRHAFLWEAGVGVIDLGDLPGGSDYSDAAGINDSGQVVGRSNAATGLHAFLWDDSFGMLDLNDLLTNPADWELYHARDINGSGQITGYGLHNGVISAFLLTPCEGCIAVPGGHETVPPPSLSVPEPVTLSLLSGGLLGIGALRLRIWSESRKILRDRAF